VLFSGTSYALYGLEFGLRFRQLHSETVVEPLVLFNADEVGPEPSAQEHNAACLKALANIYAGPASTNWLHHIHKQAQTVLGRIVSKSLSRCGIEKEDPLWRSFV
jgi:hypothetical protein